MNVWIRLKDSWIVKPIKNGISISNYEKNINIDLSAFSSPEKKEIISIIKGSKPLRRGEEIKKLIKRLKNENAVSYSNKKEHFKLNKNRTLERLRKNFISEKGPILGTYLLNPKNSKFYPTNSYICSGMYYFKGKRKLIKLSSGIDQKKDLAEIKAIMEALERFASGEIPSKELLRTSARKLGEKGINPNKIIRYNDEQYNHSFFPFKKFSKDKIYYWKRLYSFPLKKSFYLPIEFIYYPINKHSDSITFCNSSGVAAGFSKEETIKRCVFEIIERDAFMITWINRLRMPRIRINRLSQGIKKRIDMIRKTGFKTYIINLTLDTLPVILICAVSEDPASLILGAGSDISFSGAIDKALSEIEMGIYWDLRNNNKYRHIKPENVRSIDDHIMLYKSKEFVKMASFLWKGSEGYFHNKEFKNIDDLIKKMKLNILLIDLTPVNFKFVKIYRVIIPEFVPISFGYGREPLGMERLIKVPLELGKKTRRWKNLPLPHPFP